MSVNIYLFFSFQLASLCIIGSRFICLIRTDSNVFFLWLSNIPLHICTTASLSIQTIHGHLGCFHVLAVVNSASVNIGVHVFFFFFQFWFPQGLWPVVGLLDHIVVLFLVF